MKKQPSFWLPFADLGVGVVDTTAMRGGAAATFTRATTAWAKLSSGLWGSVASGSPRSFYSGFTTVAGSYVGYLAEGSRVNSCLQARDLSNASWTKTTATGAKDQAGIDGTASSASSLLATAGNATATQALTIVSAAKTFSVWIKRITGTGTIQISLDNFATNTDVTSLINSSTYTQVTMTQTLANPTVGIKIVTNTDKIAVDMAQLEDSASFASTPIPTTVAAVTRNADILTYPFAAGSTGTIIAGAMVFAVGGSNPRIIVQMDDTTNNNSIMPYFADNDVDENAFQVITGGVTQANIAGSFTITANTAFKGAYAYAVNDFATCAQGGAIGTDTSGTVPAMTTVRVGNNASPANNFFGAISRIAYYQQRLPNEVLKQLTT